MKKFRFYFSTAIFCILVGFYGCSGGNTNNTSSDSTRQTVDTSRTQQTNLPQDTTKKNPNNAQLGPGYTSAWICPEHHEGSDKAGTCSKCGMDYMKNVNK